MAETKEPQRILGSWAGIETMMTWCIAAHLTRKDETRFELFMRYCAANVPEQRKVQMFLEIAQQIRSRDGRIYDELGDDLERIRSARNKVAHSTAIQNSAGEVVYVKLTRSGRMEQASRGDLETEVAEALSAQAKIGGALAAVMSAVGFNPLNHGW